MKKERAFTRVPAFVLVTLFIVGALFAVLTAVQAVGAAPDAFDCASADVNEQDCRALVELYESTNGHAWIDNTNWLSGSPCSGWFGVTCSGKRVQQIVLSSNNLVGTLPASVLNMDSLTLLHLGVNQLGGAIPEVTNAASPLSGLYLNMNAFEGPIPASLGNLSALHFLYLNGNMLSGAVPAELCALKPISEGDGTLSLSHNALENGETASDICLDVPDNQWRATQTVPPAPRLRLEADNAATTNENGQLTIRWKPIDFTEGGGFYEVFKSTTSGVYGDEPAARTTNKLENSVTVGEIEAGVDYFFVVRTKSFASEFNPNVVTSEFSNEITNNPVALTLADFQAIGQASPLLAIAAAFIILSILSAVTLADFTRRR